MIRHDWKMEEIRDIYSTPLLDLIYRAASVHKHYNDTGEVQVCTLLSIKTGGFAWGRHGGKSATTRISTGFSKW